MQTTIASLLVRLKDRQNSVAWQEFDAIYRSMLHRFAMSRGSDAAADDVVQQCMTAIHEHIDGFEYDPTRGGFKGWLRTLVNNRVRNLLRDQHERPAESQDLKRGQVREQSPEEAFENLWMEEHLKNALRLVRGEVDETTFQAFQKYGMEERTAEAVCEELKISANQPYKIKWRLTQKLGEKMKELLGEDE